MKILLIDHHELFRNGLRYVLRKLHDEVDEILEAGDFHEGLNLAGRHPGLVLLELNSPGCEGAVSIKLFRRRFPNIPLVVVSSEEDYRVIDKVLNYGASGFVCKNSGEAILLGALRLALEGSIYVPPQYFPCAMMAQNRIDYKAFGLTERQRHILGLLTAGLSNKEISEAIQIAEGTVKVHVAAVFQVLQVGTRAEAVRVAKRMGLFSPS